MSKRKSTPYEVDDEFFAQIDFCGMTITRHWKL